MDLFAPVSLGDLQLANRVVMAPLTRLRSGDAGVPGALVADHYAQRASVGLIITEGTFPNAESRAYPGQPGIVDRRAGRGLAPGGRGGARPRRADRDAGHARRAGLAYRHQRQRPDRRAQRDRHPRRGADAGRQAALPRAARAEHRGGAGHAGRHRRRVGARGRRGPGRRRDPQRQRLPAARVPLAGVQRAHRRVRRQPGEPRPLRRRGRPPRSPRRSAPARSASASRPSTTSRTRSSTTTRTCWPPTVPWSTGCARWGWPI